MEDAAFGGQEGGIKGRGSRGAVSVGDVSSYYALEVLGGVGSGYGYQTPGGEVGDPGGEEGWRRCEMG